MTRRQPSRSQHGARTASEGAVLLGFVIALLVCGSAPAAAERCKGCILELPEAKDPVPLVVILHGDREHAAPAAERWRAAIKKRHWGLLAIECPHQLGCADSFWKWNGDPDFIRAQVAATPNVDRSRVYLVGWSGGATYMGYRATAWASTFAALVLHGGGGPPDSNACADRLVPVYFLVGNKNPLHYRMKELREYFDTCKHDVIWDLIDGADHAHEEAALTPKKAAAILDWLATHKR
jgi:predicted esterase